MATIAPMRTFWLLKFEMSSSLVVLFWEGDEIFEAELIKVIGNQTG